MKEKNSQSLSRLWVQYNPRTGHSSSRWPSNSTGSDLQYLCNTLNVTYIHPFSIPASPALRIARGCWSQSRHVIGRKVGSYPRQVAGLSQSHVEPNACLWTKQTKQGFSSGIVPCIAEELMPSARTTVIERVSHQNMEAEQRRKWPVAPPGCRNVLAALAALHEKKACEGWVSGHVL